MPTIVGLLLVLVILVIGAAISIVSIILGVVIGVPSLIYIYYKVHQSKDLSNEAKDYFDLDK